MNQPHALFMKKHTIDNSLIASEQSNLVVSYVLSVSSISPRMRWDKQVDCTNEYNNKHLTVYKMAIMTLR